MYGPHGNDDLVVLAHSDNPDGVGVGPKGNDPAKKHSFRNGWVYYPNSYVTPKEESKEVTTFKAGDKVSFHEKNNVHWQGGHGIITAVNGTRYDVEIVEAPPRNTAYRKGNTIRGIENYSGWMTLVEPAFTFADIQVGDTIRRTEKWDNTGSVRVFEGVVTTVSSVQALTAEGLLVGFFKDGANPHMTLELLNRPEPEPEPEPVKADWELAKSGDRLVVEGKETTRILTKQEDDWWDCLMVRTWGEPGRGIRRTDNDVRIAFGDSHFSKDGTYKFFPTK